MADITTDDAFRNGVMKEAARLGISHPDAVLARCEAERIAATGVEMQQMLCKAGATVLACAGMDDCLEYHILCKCASSDILLSNEARSMYVEPVQVAFEKSALFKGIGGAAGVDLALGETSTLGAAMMLLGMAGGGAYYLARKKMGESDAKTEAKIEQARIYREAAERIRKEMAARMKREQQPAADTTFTY